MSVQSGSIATAGRRLLLLLIVLVAFGLRCLGLDWQELRGDEAFGYFFSLPPYSEIVKQTFALSEPHPVASYWLQHLWLGWAGHSEFALRFTGVWWSVLAVALMAPLAAQLALPKWSAIISSALLAVSPYVIWHAQDARMYSMSLALTMASTVLALTWWRASGRKEQLWWAASYLLVTWLALQTHYFAFYVVAAQQMALLGWAITERAWRKLALWWGVGLVLLLLWLPWLIAARSILLDYHGNGDSPGLLDALVRALSAFGVGESMPSEWRWALLVLAMLAWGALALWQAREIQARLTLWFLAVYWLLPLAATWLSALNRPIFNERYLLAAVPPVYLLMAAAGGFQPGAARRPIALWLGRRAIVFVILGMIFGLAYQMNTPAFSKTRGWRELASTLATLSAGVDPAYVRLVQNYPDPTLWYYYQGAVPHLVLPPAANDAARTTNEVEQLVTAGVGRVILVEQPNAAWDGNGVAQAALGARYSQANQTKVAQWPVSIWLNAPHELAPLRVAYAGGLELAGALITPTVLSPGGVVELYLRWQYDEGDGADVGAQEAVSVQILDGSGQLVGQSDRPLMMASSATAPVAAYAILLPTPLARGEYAVNVVVYDPDRAGAPRRLTEAGADSVPLGKITLRE